jgi:hypothetical protein
MVFHLPLIDHGTLIPWNVPGPVLGRLLSVEGVEEFQATGGDEQPLKKPNIISPAG